jgi:hypothetical protein
MPKVIIVKPNNTLEEEKKALERVADVLSKMTEEECGIKVRYELKFNRKYENLA